jgi:hypothetical protein
MKMPFDKKALMMQGTLQCLEAAKWASGIYFVSMAITTGFSNFIAIALVCILSISTTQGILKVLSEIEKHLRDLKELRNT